MRILVVDDEAAILETVQRKLKRDGYEVFVAGSAEEGTRIFNSVRPDLMILDVMLPMRSGYDMCKAVRRVSTTPIIFLTARAGEQDKVAGLEMGGDDYVVKPFSLAELSARVKSVLRRTPSDPIEEVVEVADLKIDPKTHEAFKAGQKLNLSPKEFALIYFLAKHSGQVFSRETLLDRVWGQDAYVSPRTVDVHVRWLRENIEDSPSQPQHLLTVRGIGYKFVS